MRRIVPLVSALVLIAACGGAEGPTDPAALQNCDEVAAAAVAVIQDSIDLMDAASTSQSEPDPDTVAGVEAAGAAIEARATELGCSDAEMASLMADLASDLEAESVFGQLVIESLRAGEDSFFGDG